MRIRGKSQYKAGTAGILHVPYDFSQNTQLDPIDSHFSCFPVPIFAVCPTLQG